MDVKNGGRRFRPKTAGNPVQTRVKNAFMGIVAAMDSFAHVCIYSIRACVWKWLSIYNNDLIHIVENEISLSCSLYTSIIVQGCSLLVQWFLPLLSASYQSAQMHVCTALSVELSAPDTIRWSCSSWLNMKKKWKLWILCDVGSNKKKKNLGSPTVANKRTLYW